MDPAEYALAILKQYPNVTLTQVYTRTKCISNMEVREMDLHFVSTHYRPQVSLREHTLAASLLGSLSLQLLLHPEYLSLRLHFDEVKGVHHTNKSFMIKNSWYFPAHVALPVDFLRLCILNLEKLLHVTLSQSQIMILCILDVS